MTIILGTSGHDSLVGGIGDDEIYGLDGNDTLSGDSGVDTLVGGAGDDVYMIDAANIMVIEAAGEGDDEVRTTLPNLILADNVENLTFTGAGDFSGAGNGLANTLTGGAGNDTLSGLGGDDWLDGGAGINTLIGGLSDDTYVVNGSADDVVEAAGEGIDTVRSAVSYILGDNVENLALTGSAAVNGAGNALNNIIAGNSAANTLSGGAGADTMTGGAGNDTYIVDDADDIVGELAGEGADTIRTSLNAYTLGSNIENLVFTGTGDFAGTGNSLNNTLTGGADNDALTGMAGNDWLDGAAGADTLTGGTGADTYVVDDAGDVIIELAGEGADTVRTSLNTYTLGDNVENLVFTGAGDFTGAGNTLNNTLTGGSGADTLTGGAGNDTYVVDNVGDVVVELASEGADTVRSSIAYTLADTLENLTLTGSAAIDGAGNASDNAITGNSAANVLAGLDGDDTLNGGGGADTMIGGAGDDVYYVDNSGDVVAELAGEGADTVNASISYTLGVNLENLTLTGSGAINGAGNDLDNVITGNGAANTLSGGVGSDTLIGGAGNDVYIISSATDANDTIIENAGQGTDEVRTDLASYTLGANLEKLTYTGSGDFIGTGNAFDNALNGAGGADTLSGGDGDDTLAGGGGADVIDGGAGSDTADYSSSAAAVAVNLATGAAAGGDAAGDTLTAIENLTGSAYDDVLTGDSGDNILIGGAGADTLTGGEGNDTASYALSISTVAADLAVGTGAVGDAAGDVLSGIENLTGGTGNDTLRGDGGTNVLDGGSGDDLLEGRGGDDTLIGGAGTDTAVFSGNVTDYLATKNGAVWTFTDMAGGDGTDTLQGVEQAQFADRLIYLDGRNNAPIVPGNVEAATDEDAVPLNVNLLQGVWDFDTADTLSIVGLTQTGGAGVNVTVNNGMLTLDPGQLSALAAGGQAVLSFAYGVSDGAATAARSLAVTVDGRNDAPTVAAPLTAITDEDAALLVVNLLQGATDIDIGNVLSVSSFAQTGGRTATISRSGANFTLDPSQFNDLAVSETETLTFAYGVSDGGAAASQTLTVTLAGKNDAPTATADSAATGYGATLMLSAPTLLANDHDPDTSDTLSVTGVGNAVHGTVTRDSAGNILFAPGVGYSGAAAFDYTIGDGHGGSATATVSVSVAAASGGAAGAALASLIVGPEVSDTGVNGLAQNLDQGYVQVLADGGYVKVWWTADGNSSDVYARRYNSAGAASGAAFRVNTTTALNQGEATVAALVDGGFVISWASMNGSWVDNTNGTGQIYQQRYNSAGGAVGGETLVNTSSSASKLNPSTVGMPGGGWVTVWTSFGVDQTGTWGVYGQRFNADGSKAGSEFRVNTTVAGSQNNPKVVSLSGGGFVVQWDSVNGQDGSGAGSYFQRYDANGAKAGGETRANVLTAGNQSVGSIAGLADGGFVVSWSGDGAQDGDVYGVFGRVFNADGTARSVEFQLNQLSTGNQLHPAVTGLADGSFVALWRSIDTVTGNQVIMGRRCDAGGGAIGGEFQVSDDSYSIPGVTRSHPSVAARSDGGFVAYWQDPTSGDTAFITRVFEASDEAPIILAGNTALKRGADAAITALFDPSHTQGGRWVGGALQQIAIYEFADLTADKASGYFTLDGVAQVQGTTMTVAAGNLSHLRWHSGAGMGGDAVRIRGFDGHRWSDWVEADARTVSGKVSFVAGTELRDTGGSGVFENIEQGHVAVLSDGSHVKVWWTADGNTSDVYARRYDATGAVMGAAFRVNTATALNQGSPTVAALADGGFLISWLSMDGSVPTSASPGAIFQQRYDGAGVAIGGEVRVATHLTSPKDRPSTVGLDDGGWVTIWQGFSVDAANTWGAYGRRFNANGLPVGGEFQVNTTVAGSQGDVKVAKLTGGGFVVQWDSVDGQDGSGGGVYFQRYDANSAKVGGETRANVTTAGNQANGSVTGLTDGGMMMTWGDSGLDGGGYGVYGRIFNADGSARTGEFRLNQTTAGDQLNPTVAALADGTVMTMWRAQDAGSQFVIMGRSFDTTGAAMGDEFQISDGGFAVSSTATSHPSISALPNGGYVAYWQDPTSNTGTFVTKIFSADGIASGGFVGTDGDDVLFGSSRSDTLTGGLGADVFHFENPMVGLDTITDFQLGDDRIEVLAAEFDNLPIGQLSADRFSSDGVVTADTRFIFDPNVRVLSYDADGSGAGAAVGLATLNTSIFNYTGVFMVS